MSDIENGGGQATNGNGGNGNGHGMNGNGHAGNGHGMNGNGHATNGNGHAANGNGHATDGNGAPTGAGGTAPGVNPQGQPRATAVAGGGRGGNSNGAGRRFTTYGYWPDGTRRTTPPPAPNPYLQFALRWWKVMLPIVLVGVIGTAVYFLRGPKTYESAAMIIIPPPTGSDAAIAGSNLVRSAAQNYAAQIPSQLIFGLVSAAVQDRFPVTVRELSDMAKEKDIQVATPGGANVLSVSVRDENPEKARTLAGTIASTFVKYINDRSGSGIADRQAAVQDKIQQASEKLVVTRLYQNEAELEKSLQADRSQYLQLQANYRRELADQAEMRRLTAQAASGAALTPSQQARLEQLSAIASGTRQQSMDLMLSQQQRSEQTVADLRDRLSQVQAEIAARGGNVGPQSPATIADDAQRKTLETREADLSRALNDARSNLLRLRTSYQSELARQAAEEAAAAAPPPTTGSAAQGATTPPVTAADLQRQIDTLTQQRAATQKALDDVQRTLTNTTAGTAWVVETTPVTGVYDPQSLSLQQISAQRAQQQQQIQANQARASDLTRQLAEQDASLNQLRQQQAQVQADASRQAAESAARAAVASQPVPTPTVSALTRQARAEQVRVSEMMRQQRDDAEQGVAALEQQLAEVRTALARTPGNTSGSGSSLGQAVGDQGLRELQAREQQLQSSLDSEEARLVQLRQNINGELIRSAETEAQQVRSDLVAEQARLAAQPAQPDPTAIAAAREADAMRQEWLGLMAQVMADLGRNIATNAAQLAAVRQQIEDNPNQMDPATASLFGDAYAGQLSALTAELVAIQLNTRAVTQPLETFGGPSDPVVAPGQKKAALLGLGGSMALALAVAGALELLRRRKSQHNRPTSPTAGVVERSRQDLARV